MSALQRKLLGGLPPMPTGGMSGGGKRGLGGPGKRRDYTPVKWDTYFDQEHDVVIGNDSFRVYEKGSEGPVCLYLHGGGFSALSWACLSKELTNVVLCRCLAIDLRGHGDTRTEDEEDFSAETMAKDVGNVVEKLYGDDPPPIILVGHSMGGALAIRAAFNNLLPSLIGLIVIDVVEGTALEALNSMQSFLKSRPKVFKSLEYAIEWCVRSGHVRNPESAKVSMVGQLKRVETDETATSEMQNSDTAAAADSSSSFADAITEEDEVEMSTKKLKAADISSDSKPPASQTNLSHGQYTWRIDLAKTEKYWRGWFEGMSKMFLACSVPKILILAGVDRLDKDLTVGQMQGKFQMQVLPQSGHAIHEDVPDKVSDVMATFLVRHRVAEANDNFQRTFPAC